MVCSDSQALCARCLSPAGRLLMQILNYDRIKADGERALPINVLPDPDDSKATIVFVWLMELRPDGRVIFMPATLKLRTDREEPLELLTSQRLEIRGWRHGGDRARLRRQRLLLDADLRRVRRRGLPKESRDVIFIAS